MSTDGGYDCDFVEEPPKALQSECPVCHLVLREPCQVNCCGYGFCKVCIEKVESSNKPCPCCRSENFNKFPDKRLKRSLSGLKVTCVNTKDGCVWSGELGNLDDHLNESPSEERQLKGCSFAEIPCSHCSRPTKRFQIGDHQDDCPKRPFTCQYCKDYHSTFEDVTTNHWPQCVHFPVTCPNECGRKFKRFSVDGHVADSCELTVVDCNFRFAGCSERLPRNAMYEHLSDSHVKHLSLQAAHYKNEIIRLEGDNGQLREQLIEFQGQLADCQERLKKFEHDLRPKVEKLVQDVQILMQPKQKAAKRRWRVSYSKTLVQTV